MLAANPDERASVDDVICHPWFTAGPDPSGDVIQHISDMTAALVESIPLPGVQSEKDIVEMAMAPLTHEERKGLTKALTQHG